MGRAASLLLLLTFGCVHHHPGSSIVAEAERLLAQSRALDYGAPQQDPGVQLRVSAAERFLDACRKGDHDSCWRAGQLELDDPERREATVATATNCAGGDDLSCRALRELKVYAGFDYPSARRFCDEGLGTACFALGRLNFAEDPKAHTSAADKRGCELGDSRSCAQLPIEVAKERVLAAAKKECDRGIADGCQRIGDTSRLEKAAAEGCRTGLVEDCEYLDDDASKALRELALTQLCANTVADGSYCGKLADLYLEAGDQASARDALEQGCEHMFDDDMCLRLAQSYLTHQLAEPVPGRGADLATYMCNTRQQADACALLAP